MPEHRVAPIGGYFALEPGRTGRLPYAEGVLFQSARAAFHVLLQTGRPRKVWMPKFICNSMVSPLDALQIECVWYDLKDDLTVDDAVEIDSDDWLLYVNYFGVCDSQVSEILTRFAPDQVVLDFSQAFFSPPRLQAAATIYSPRKFFGLPDGGMLVGQYASRLPHQPQDTSSQDRMSHLLQRLVSPPEFGYADYCRAEESLVGQEPKQMSALTERLFTAIDFEQAKQKRMENYSFLNQALGDRNLIALDRRQLAAPLCYPFLTTDSDLRQRLIERRIFIPTYWADSRSRVGPAWAEKMVNNLLPLPIDQRYGREDMQRLLAEIRGDGE